MKNMLKNICRKSIFEHKVPDQDFFKEFKD